MRRKRFNNMAEQVGHHSDDDPDDCRLSKVNDDMGITTHAPKNERGDEGHHARKQIPEHFICGEFYAAEHDAA
jgi:hypothetical protein